jgi:hypothetical protein
MVFSLFLAVLVATACCRRRRHRVWPEPDVPMGRDLPEVVAQTATAQATATELPTPLRIIVIAGLLSVLGTVSAIAVAVIVGFALFSQGGLPTFQQSERPLLSMGA